MYILEIVLFSFSRCLGLQRKTTGPASVDQKSWLTTSKYSSLINSFTTYFILSSAFIHQSIHSPFIHSPVHLFAYHSFFLRVIPFFLRVIPKTSKYLFTYLCMYVPNVTDNKMYSRFPVYQPESMISRAPRLDSEGEKDLRAEEGNYWTEGGLYERGL